MLPEPAEDAQSLLGEGAYGLLTKPFSSALLLDAISVVMRDQRVDLETLSAGR